VHRPLSLALVLPVVFALACGDTPEAEAPAPEAAAEADATPQQKTTDEPPVERAAIVREVVSTEKYTFARMDACGAEAWVAGPVHGWEVGQSVKMTGGMGMTDFHSDTLDRTFEKILFVDSWEEMGSPLVCDGAESSEAPPAADPDVPSQDFRVGTVKEAMDAAGYTYVRLDVCGDDVWIAAPTTSVEIGSYGATPIGSEMIDFKSTTLDRTFESIWFVSWIKRSSALPPC
jgi:hypothetical protein